MSTSSPSHQHTISNGKNYHESFQSDFCSLNGLPTEILMKIFTYLDPLYGDRILGYHHNKPGVGVIKDQHLFKDFLHASKDYIALSLTCKRLTPLAQEHLFRGPVIHSFTHQIRRIVGGYAESDLSPAVKLARTLLQRPELGRLIKQMRIYLPVPESAFAENYHFLQSPSSTQLHATLQQAKVFIEGLGLSKDLTKLWVSSVILSHHYALIGVLLALAPDIKRLCISQSTLSGFETPNYEYIYAFFGLRIKSSVKVPLDSIQKLPAIRSLTYLKVVGPYPIRLQGINHFPNLGTLDLSVHCQPGWFAHNHTHRKEEPHTHLNNITHLRLDFQVSRMGSGSMFKQSCFHNTLRRFRNLQTLDLYAEPSTGKDPLWRQRGPRSVVEIADSGDISTFSAHPNLISRIGSILNVSQIVTLRLPGSIWARQREYFHGFQEFSSLRNLIVPQEAILPFDLNTYSISNHTLEETLPPSLRYLKIFDANDAIVPGWLEVFFDTQIDLGIWPELGSVEVLFGIDFLGWELKQLISRKNHEEFWLKVDLLKTQRRFQLVLGRDEDIPELGLDMKGQLL